jgi:hypothetical protein
MRALLAGALFATAGCGASIPNAPDWIVNRQPLPFCGEETVGPDGGHNLDARRCLLAAFESGGEGELISHATTIEGDPRTQLTRVHANGVEIFVDATSDRFGAGRWVRLTCQSLTAVDDATAAPVFTEDECEEQPIP